MNKNSITHRFTITLSIWCVSLLLPTQNACAYFLDLGQAGFYNAFVLGDTSGYRSDVEGRLAVGGNLNLEHFGVGRILGDDWNHRDTMIVGQDIRYRHGRVYHGNVAFGGSIDIDESVGLYSEDSSKTNGAIVPDINLDFAALAQELHVKSQTWANFAVTGSVDWEHSLLTLSGARNGVNVFSVTAEQLSATQKFTLDIPTDAWALINVSGSSVTMNNFGFFRVVDGETIQVPDNAPPFRHDGALTQRVLFNLNNANSLLLHAIGIKGSLLAPLADTVFYDGHIDGNLIVASLQGKEGQLTGQVNLYPFKPIPIPSMLPIISIALSGLMALARWRSGVTK